MTEKNVGGRPNKLVADEPTIKQIRALGQIQATSKECAAVMGVTEPTWIKFKKDNPIVVDALAEGQGEGRASLRRRQFKAADEGNATMLVWLGKQYLGQTDKQEIATTVDVQVTDARSSLESIITRQLAARGDQEDAITTH